MITAPAFSFTAMGAALAAIPFAAIAYAFVAF